MSLTLHFHPLSLSCWKALIALYENDTPFNPQTVNLGGEAERAALLKLWPIGKFPVLRDDARDQTVPETSTIIEYLDRHYPGRTRFIPADTDLAWQTRLSDRFYDFYVHHSMQKIVGDRLRSQGTKDPHGVEEASRTSSCFRSEGLEPGRNDPLAQSAPVLQMHRGGTPGSKTITSEIILIAVSAPQNPVRLVDERPQAAGLGS